MKGLKGKVVVIDFWATWCGPCVAEMPKMKELYAKYRDQGVEFIGVSLDQPKEQRRARQAQEIRQGKWRSPGRSITRASSGRAISQNRGAVNSIPCVFVVDTEGKLYSVEARGKLEEMIPELLKKKNAPARGGAAASNRDDTKAEHDRRRTCDELQVR